MNLPTILIGLLILAVFVAIIVQQVRKKKRGESGCSCGCSGCAGSDICHPTQYRNRPAQGSLCRAVFIFISKILVIQQRKVPRRGHAEYQLFFSF